MVNGKGLAESYHHSDVIPMIVTYSKFLNICKQIDKETNKYVYMYMYNMLYYLRPGLLTSGNLN